MKTIHHFVSGTSRQCESGRFHPVFDPATGEQTARVALADANEVDTAVASAKAAFEDWRDTSLAARTKLMFAFRNLVEANAAEIAARLDRRARQSPLGCSRRGGPGLGEHRACVRARRPAQGQLQLPGLIRRRRVHGAPAAGGGGWDHAVQLPGDGAVVDDPQRGRLRQHVRAQAVGEGSVGASAGGRTVRRGRVPARRAERGQRRQGGRRPAVDASRRGCGELRGVHCDRPLRVRDGHLGGQAGPGPRRGQEPHGGPARRRHRPGRRFGGVGGLRLRGRALHGRVGGGGGGRLRRSAGRRHQRCAWTSCASGPETTPSPRWAR